MFKFGFTSNKEDDENENCYSHIKDIKWDDSKEIECSKETNGAFETIQINTIKSYDVEVNYFNSNEVLKALQKEQNLENISILKADHNNSDLLPAVYEGGWKIWECTFDLLNYINDNRLYLKNKNVLDLGCGAGIIGILSLLKGSTCYFQDYNSEVIRYITIPNVMLNTKECLNHCKFFSGDWQSFSYLLEGNLLEDENKFDYIFTSETIYNIQNYSKLHRVFEKSLKQNGTIFLAAKSFYFGVGGGITLFQDYLKKSKIFKYTSCWNNSIEGIKREILKIEFSD